MNIATKRLCAKINKSNVARNKIQTTNQPIYNTKLTTDHLEI